MKLDRIAKEIDKAKAKMAEMQARLADLEKQKTEMENMEIINLVRSVNLPQDGLAALIRSYRETGKPPAEQAAPMAASEKIDEPEDSLEGEYDDDEE